MLHTTSRFARGADLAACAGTRGKQVGRAAGSATSTESESLHAEDLEDRAMCGVGLKGRQRKTRAHDPMMRAAIAAGMALGLLATAAFAAGDPAAGKLKAAVCSACHGSDGNSVNPIWPKLAGQGVPYQMRQILAIRSEHGRANPEAATMVPMVANLSEQDLADISAFFATQVSTVEAANPGLAEAGRRLYQAGDMTRGIPSCMSCHGPGGRGNALAAFPKLGGQFAAYSAKQLRAYRDGSRTTDPAGMMRTIASRLTDADIKAVSEYLSGLHHAGN